MVIYRCECCIARSHVVDTLARSGKKFNGNCTLSWNVAPIIAVVTQLAVSDLPKLWTSTTLYVETLYKKPSFCNYCLVKFQKPHRGGRTGTVKFAGDSTIVSCGHRSNPDNFPFHCCNLPYI